MNPWFPIVTGHFHNSYLVALFLDASLKSFVLLAVIAGLSQCWRGASAAKQHLIWFLGVLILPTLPLLSSVLPSWHQPLCSVSTPLVSGNQVSLVLALPSSARPGPPTVDIGTPKTDIRAASKSNGPLTPTPGLATRFDARWLALALVLWLAGVASVLVSVAVSRLHLRSIRQRAEVLSSSDWLSLLSELRTALGVRRPVVLLRSADNVMPVTWGWWQPLILLPVQASEWSLERRRVVLMHELAHIKRLDCLTQLMASVICALFWFNPLVWLAAQRMRIERERACDDLVLSSGWHPSDYATHLLDMARSFRRVPQVAAIAMARSPGLERRLVAILDGHRNRQRVARSTIALIALATAGAGLSLGDIIATVNTRSASSWSFGDSQVAEQLKHFVAEKQAQATATLQKEGKEMLPEFSAMFAAGANGDWPSVRTIWSNLRERAPQYDGKGPKDERLHGTAWQTMLEIWGSLGNIFAGNEEQMVTLGRDAIASIPAGSIYFGGTDPGRCVITALCKSQVHADPFFTLTQNALADGSYLQYLRDMYGASVYIPTQDDSQKCFNDYLADAQRRLTENRLKPGESVTRGADGQIHVSGQVAVMDINARLAKLIFDKNPQREFYLEESFPLDWMYPHLAPNGPILRINRQPLEELSSEIVKKDHEYWTGTVEPLIGGWLSDNTPVMAVADYARKISMPPLIGDPRDPQEDSTQKWAAKLRSSIAGLYVWRMEHAATESDKARMASEADFAFRQAFVLCPYSPEAVFRYVNFLAGQGRLDDAQLVAEAAASVDQKNLQFRGLAENVKKAASRR